MRVDMPKLITVRERPLMNGKVCGSVNEKRLSALVKSINELVCGLLLEYQFESDRGQGD